MLTSTSPLGERARGQRWGLTVAALALGGALGGATTGALLGAAGALLRPPRPALLAGLGLLAAALLDLRGLQVGRRQVDEAWRERYRGWVYGAGYGYQLGLAVVTVVTSAATPALLLVLLLTGSPAAGALLGVAFGAGRALPLLGLRRTVDPAGLRRAARRLAALARPASLATSAALAGLGTLLLAAG